MLVALIQTFSQSLCLYAVIFISFQQKKEPNGCMKYKTVNIWCSDKELNSAGDSPERRRKKILPLWVRAADHPSRAQRKTDRVHSSLHYVMLIALSMILFLPWCFSTAFLWLNIVILQYKHRANRSVLITSAELWLVCFMGNSSVHVGLKWILMEMSRLF